MSLFLAMLSMDLEAAKRPSAAAKAEKLVKRTQAEHEKTAKNAEQQRLKQEEEHREKLAALDKEHREKQEHLAKENRAKEKEQLQKEIKMLELRIAETEKQIAAQDGKLNVLKEELAKAAAKLKRLE